MPTSTFLGAQATANVLIPLIRLAATIGFAVAPSSLGFTVIAVAEQFIRWLLVQKESRFCGTVLACAKFDDKLAKRCHQR
jgi:hypothetical protein